MSALTEVVGFNEVSVHMLYGVLTQLLYRELTSRKYSLCVGNDVGQTTNKQIDK
jgi:hypothetical protein